MNKVRTRRRNTSKNRKKRNTRNNRNTRNTRKRKVSTKRRRVKSKRRASSLKGGAFCSARPKSDDGWKGGTAAAKIKSTRSAARRKHKTHNEEYYQDIIDELTKFVKDYMTHHEVDEDNIMFSASPRVRDFILTIHGRIEHYQTKKEAAGRHPSRSAASARGTSVQQQSA
tara:strand:+ start:366 stop:875 length:510 start_codon:yes stop_codon:yes gene_type:complete